MPLPAPRFLGFLSAGLGAAYTVVPGITARMMGIQPTFGTRLVIRAVGVRELSVVPGLLGPRPLPWLLARLAGDAMDVLLLAAMLRRGRQDGNSGLLGVIATAELAAIASTDAAVTAATWRAEARRPRRAFAAVTVHAPESEVRAQWREVEVPPPAQADECTVTYSPSPDGGTEVRLSLAFHGTAMEGSGRSAALGRTTSVHAIVLQHLAELKRRVETGGVLASDGAPEGVRSAPAIRPAQPSRVLAGSAPSLGGTS